jgi:DUF1680 family protein
LDAYRANPETYRSKTRVGDLEALRSLETMATMLGLKRDEAIEGLLGLWRRSYADGQAADGYLQDRIGLTIAHPPTRWQSFPLSHETLYVGRYIEAAVSLKEATGDTVFLGSAIRAADNMASALLDSDRPYSIGHAEIEQALMRLYAVTGDVKYLRLCEWLLLQYGKTQGRPFGGKKHQDHLPLKEQRTIEGHAVSAAFLFNGVTQYVGATGDPDYREAVLAVWDDLVERKMYLQGVSGQTSSGFEGYKTEPYSIDPDDTYGESCGSFGNFQWAHSLFSLTGEARFIDVAERILYNALYASLSLAGDSYFYQNFSAAGFSRHDDGAWAAVARYSWHPVPCCPPNIMNLFSKIGGYFYSIDSNGIYVKHYGASEAHIPYGNGVSLRQQGDYPWSGNIHFEVEPKQPTDFTLHLRVPEWARSFRVRINAETLAPPVREGWACIRRLWKAGDRVELELPMPPERVTMPPQFQAFKGLAALRRGPMIYCLEQQDVPVSLVELALPANVELKEEFRADLLGGVVVIKATLPYTSLFSSDTPPVEAMFVPYGLWNNRSPGFMSIWLDAKPFSMKEWLEEQARLPQSDT